MRPVPRNSCRHTGSKLIDQLTTGWVDHCNLLSFTLPYRDSQSACRILKYTLPLGILLKICVMHYTWYVGFQWSQVNMEELV